MQLPLTIDDIRAAAARLAGVALRTPPLTSYALDAATGVRLVLKPENLQRTGSFKIRGAYNRISQLTDGERAGGVCTASSGNHGQAVAVAARLNGTHATVLMPHDAPSAKRAATQANGATIIDYDRYAQDRDALLQALVAERGLVPVSAFDDYGVMAGQGTVALELLEDAGELDALVVPVGGGGLCAGCGTAVRALQPHIELIGVEPEAADDTRRSLVAGERVRIDVPRTIADGLQSPAPGELTFPLNRRLLDDVLTVSEEQIAAAMRLLFGAAKLVAEPSGATALAAILAHPQRFAARAVGVVITGGNADPDRYAELIGGAGSL